MKYSIFLFLFLCFWGGSCSVQSKQTNSLQDEDGGLLWKISGNGLQKDSYLLGTMHSVGRTYLDSIPGFRKVFRSVQQIAIEQDVFTEDSIGRVSRRTLPAYVYMPEDTTYEMLYRQTDYLFVDSILREGNSRYFRYKPLFWFDFWSSRKLSQKVKNKQSTMDIFILLMGFQNNKKIYFMETLEEVERRRHNVDSLRYSIINLQQQAIVLCEILQDTATLGDDRGMAEKLYKKQKLSAIMELDSMAKKRSDVTKWNVDNKTKQEYKKYIEYYSNVIGRDRNEKWMKNLVPMINNDSSLIAVGAAHLIGDHGLIAQLRKLGYRVTPIR